MDKINSYIKAVMDKYLIDMSYVEKREGSQVPEVIEKKYIIYNEAAESVDYTIDPNAATIFGYVLGSLIVNRLKNESQDLPNLTFSLVPLNNAAFADKVQNGPKETAKV